MRGLDPRIHLLGKKSFEAGWIAGSRPGNDTSLWFDMNASRFDGHIALVRCAHETCVSSRALTYGARCINTERPRLLAYIRRYRSVLYVVASSNLRGPISGPG